MNRMYSFSFFPALLKRKPQAYAVIAGSKAYPALHGTVRFYQTKLGTLVAAEFMGLPTSKENCSSPILGFHIHEGESCTGNDTDPFADAGTHYNPSGCPHPYHAGDMPPLFAADGRAFSAFLTKRFTVQELIGKTVIVHGSPDDFTSQPSGNAGEKLACGVIVKV